MKEFLELIVYCPFRMDLCGARSVRYLEDRRAFFEQTEKERIEDMAASAMDYYKMQKEISIELGLAPAISSFEVSEKFYEAVTAQPEFYGVCSEEGSSETWQTERLFKCG